MSFRQTRHNALPLAALLVAGLALIALPTALEARGGVEVATAVVHAGGVDLLPSVGYSRAVITVSGKGKVFRQVHKRGKGLSIGVFDPKGQLLANGVYKWELTLVPDARTARQLRRRIKEEGPSARWRSLSGTFAVRDGLIAERGLREPRPGREDVALRGGLGVDLGAAAPAARRPPMDDDAAVGFRVGVEASLRAAVPVAAARAGATEANRSSGERSDAAALALGRSAEALLAAERALRVPKLRRSEFDNNTNGANGRPRSDKR